MDAADNRGPDEPLDTRERSVNAPRSSVPPASSAPLAPASVEPDDWPHDFVSCPAMPSEFLRTQRVLPLQLSDAGLHLAMADPANDFAVKAVELATGHTVIRRSAPAEDILAAIDRLEHNRTQALPSPASPAPPPADGLEQDVEQLRDLALGTPVVRTVNTLLRDAMRLRATDIHLEPFDGRLAVRLRVDGLLREMPSPDASLAAAIISRIKILAGLDIAERRLPQDGRTRTHIDGQPVDIRVATMPAIHGESVVLRLLEHDISALEFPKLGFSEPHIATLDQALKAPHGLVIVTGPTGSGKTTTLATALKQLNAAQRKILTVEDPIEYEIPGINQTQARPGIGLTFARALRGFLRHDPDVIMVGEMRDAETAKTGVHAALTGHLVLTTLHTNTAAGAIVRLLDMGVDAYLLASTLRCVVAQRLVRTLCPNCRTNPSGNEAPTAAGCNRCQQTGYRGRSAIVEVLEITKSISRLIQPAVSEAEIEATARTSGMKTMFEAGREMCERGLTTHEEVLRVTQDA